MRIDEFILDEPGNKDDILFEMSNFGSKATGLPNGIVVWIRSDPLGHGHNKYRIKIIKDNEYAAIYLVGHETKMIKDINQTISKSDDAAIRKFAETYSSLIIELIDCKLTTDEFLYELQKLQGEKL